jgi:MFS family permease
MKEELNSIMNKIYSAERIEEIAVSSGGDGTEISFKEAVFGAQNRRATLVGVVFAITQQCSGITGVQQYLPKILTAMNTDVQIGCNVLNFVNFISVFFTGFFLKTYGRRTLMLFFPFMLAVMHCIISVCLWNEQNDETSNMVALVSIVLFIIFF